jgi:hypothetical protein
VVGEGKGGRSAETSLVNSPTKDRCMEVFNTIVKQETKYYTTILDMGVEKMEMERALTDN